MANTVWQVWRIGRALVLAEAYRAKAQGFPEKGTLENEGSKRQVESWLNMELAPSNLPGGQRHA